MTTSRRAIAALALTAAALTGCSAAVDEKTPPRISPAVTHRCQEAPPDIVAAISEAFTGGERLVSAQAVYAPGGIYVGGNIDANGQRVSSGDVWIAQRGQVFALSSDARRRTLFPDGRDFASAGDEYGAKRCRPALPTTAPARGFDMQKATQPESWYDYAHLLTPEQITDLQRWDDAITLQLLYGRGLNYQFLSQFPDPEDAHRRRMITVARDCYGALGPGRLN
ncbi:hypothetical protein [Mycolicibacterium celeriflavum]|uniref:Uncharacterized protein n=1 Tax=Mycolicibacterium celeriflavum TaxID=1249101 RepID=A0A1X0C3J9_MYCCF|nr:hypothetical protein [Mycolicibacterium celeriflavum]MCV7239545.1 hypothetical protein [Mycolicibacterium celeriflavum]ORA51621.1 hypothetical protein BST21_00615 [Mycolicibacterium celeriflavum]BBY43236.1 hypothetical protein MCEL_15310 [Mycolicibacterium celeriflavum]